MTDTEQSNREALQARLKSVSDELVAITNGSRYSAELDDAEKGAIQRASRAVDAAFLELDARRPDPFDRLRSRS